MASRERYVEEAPENSKKSSYSAHANGMNEWINQNIIHEGYSASKCHLCISLAHSSEWHFAHLQWLPLSTEKPQMQFRENCVMFMFVPVC
jgi:hypothetical protein